MDIAHEILLSQTIRRGLQHAVKSYDMGPPALLPLRRKVCCGILLPLKINLIAGFEPANLGSNGKLTNPYTTYATGKTNNRLCYHGVVAKGEV
jgi:hypothetical protein